MSWGGEYHQNKMMENNLNEIEQLENEINDSIYNEIYNKYLN
jgi:hypothetical protein